MTTLRRMSRGQPCSRKSPPISCLIRNDDVSRLVLLRSCMSPALSAPSRYFVHRVSFSTGARSPRSNMRSASSRSLLCRKAEAAMRSMAHDRESLV